MLLAARLLGSLPGSVEQPRGARAPLETKLATDVSPPETTGGHFHIRGYNREVIYSS